MQNPEIASETLEALKSLKAVWRKEILIEVAKNAMLEEGGMYQEKMRRNKAENMRKKILISFVKCVYRREHAALKEFVETVSEITGLPLETTRKLAANNGTMASGK